MSIFFRPTMSAMFRDAAAVQRDQNGFVKMANSQDTATATFDPGFSDMVEADGSTAVTTVLPDGDCPSVNSRQWLDDVPAAPKTARIETKDVDFSGLVEANGPTSLTTILPCLDCPSVNGRQWLEVPNTPAVPQTTGGSGRPLRRRAAHKIPKTIPQEAADIEDPHAVQA